MLMVGVRELTREPVEVPPLRDGTCEVISDPITNKCYPTNSQAPPCQYVPQRHVASGLCWDPKTGQYPPAFPDEMAGGGGGQPCKLGVHISTVHHICFGETAPPYPDGTCQTGYIATGNSCSIRIHDPLPDGSCPGGYRNIVVPTPIPPGGTLCKLNELKLTNDAITSELPEDSVQLDFIMFPRTLPHP